VNSPLILRAVEFAARAHNGQVDKRGDPYLFHLLRVSRAVMAATHNEQATIAALLHDVLEDTSVTEDQIWLTFGPVVLDTVKAVTRKNGDSYRGYIDSIVAKGGNAVLIKLSDIRDHLATIDEVPDSGRLKRRYLDAKAVLEDQL
jgi:(p)ppGpp synthase/HD superfamily hydrolase